MKHIITITTLALLIAFSGTAQAKEITQIELPERFVLADASISEVTLGAIATAIETQSPELGLQLNNLVISESPKPGETKRLSRNQIIRSIRTAQLPIFDIVVKGNSTFDVYGPGQSVTMDQVINALNRHTLQETGWPEDELLLRVNSTPGQDLWLPPGSIEVDFERYNNDRLGNSRVEALFYIDRIQVEKISLNVTVERKRTIPVLRQDMKRGDIITANDVVERVVFIKDRINDERLIADANKLIGNRVRTSIRQNTPVNDNQLEINYVLRRGDLVEVILSNGGLVMRTQAKAKDRGAPGQIIMVETVQTGKKIKARIINRNQVEWIQS